MTNSSYKLKPARIDSSYKFLTRFDCIDKSFLFQCSQLRLLNLNKVLIQTKFYYPPSKACLLIAGTTLEILSHQRVLIQNPKQKVFAKTFCLNSTLRKSKLLIFLDTCLITLFLDKLLSLTFSYNKVNQKLFIFFSPKIIEKLNLQTAKYSIRILNYSIQDEKLNLLPLMTTYFT